MAGFVKHNVLIRCKQTVWPYIAFLSEAAGFEVLVLKRDRIVVSDSLTGYLTKDEIVSFQFRYHQGWTSLGLG